MGFIEFKKASDLSAVVAPVKASLAMAGKAKKAKFQLTLTNDLVADLGWDEEQNLQVMLGDGEDQGKLRLRASPDSNVVLTKHFIKRKNSARVASYFRVPLGHIEQYVNRREPAQPCSFQLADDGWVEIELPAWAKDIPDRAISTGGLFETIKASPTVLPKWKLLPSEEDLVRYLASCAIGEAKGVDILKVHQQSNPDAKIGDLTQILGRIRRKLDEAGLTVQQAGGGVINLLGDRTVLFASTEAAHV